LCITAVEEVHKVSDICIALSIANVIVNGRVKGTVTVFPSFTNTVTAIGTDSVEDSGTDNVTTRTRRHSRLVVENQRQTQKHQSGRGSRHDVFVCA
jgi:hypothetical protein